MRLRTACLVATAALALVTLPAAAQDYGPPGHGMGHGDGNPILHMAKELGLSEAQTAQVKTITAKYMDGALGEAMGSMREAQAAVRRAIHDTTLTDDQVREAAAAAALLSSQIAVQHHQMAIEISRILTIDQRKKLADLFAEMKERRAGPPQGGTDGF